MSRNPPDLSDIDKKDKKQVHHYRGHLLVFIVALAVVAIWGIGSRLEASSSLRHRTKDEAIPVVAVMKVEGGPSTEEIVLPGNVQAWHEAPVFARTSGYLKDWITDIGARVKEGDLLAEIETPEVDAQLRQSEADLATAEANNQLAQSTARRWAELLKTNAVSKQEAEEKSGAAAAMSASVSSARANVERLKELEGFKRVTAPFDGTITARNTDTGALINAGSGSIGQELFRIAETTQLRVYVQMPQTYAGDVTPDLTATLYFAEHPNRTFPAKLAHTADALDPGTRTLLIELSVDNANGELLPGGYTEVHFKLPSDGTRIHLPVNTLLFRSDGMQVATVGDDNKAALKDITIGRDFGKDVEVISGLDVGSTVIINPPDSLDNGQQVKIAQPQNQDGDAGQKK